MNCSKCGAWSEVLDTRAKDGGHRTERRRRCANGHTFATVEVHGAVYCSAKQRQGNYLATVAERIAKFARNAEIVRRRRKGGEPLDAIAADLGISRSMVSLVERRAP